MARSRQRQPQGMPPEGETAPEPGWIDPALAEEFPGLALWYTTLERGSGRSTPAVKERLRQLSSRFFGSHAIALRQKPIPFAYRVFFRHIGLDPDHVRTPVEEVAIERLQHGGFRSQNLLDDALTIATTEVGVALRAFDTDKVKGRLGIRTSGAGEALDGMPNPLTQGTLVIADEERPIGLLFGATGEGRGVHPRTKRTTVAAIQVRGVPPVAIEEALWIVSGVLREGG
jgi:DNA/RNA-binding domain of Phe-tRNA-synthetase-like protein